MHIPGGETHWHGATTSTVMAHTAISLGSESGCRNLFMEIGLTRPIETSWHEELAEEDYKKAQDAK